jgi:hypothetical protein
MTLIKMYDEAAMEKIEAFEMCLYRKMLKVSSTEHIRVTHAEILGRSSKEKEILNTIKTRKLQYLGHIM